MHDWKVTLVAAAKTLGASDDSPWRPVLAKGMDLLLADANPGQVIGVEQDDEDTRYVLGNGASRVTVRGTACTCGTDPVCAHRAAVALWLTAQEKSVNELLDGDGIDEDLSLAMQAATQKYPGEAHTIRQAAHLASRHELDEMAAWGKCPCASTTAPGGHCIHRWALALKRRAVPDPPPIREPERLVDADSQIKNGPKRPLADMLADLARPLPESVVATRKQGGETIRYLHWHTLAMALDAYAPGWEYSVLREHVGESECSVVVQLGLHGSDGSRCYEAIGSDTLRTNRQGEIIESYGSMLERAERVAFRRACAMAGLGRHLYIRDAAGEAAIGFFGKDRV